MEYVKHGHDDPNYVDHLYIGKVDLTVSDENVINEYGVGKLNFKQAGLCSIEVFGDEGLIPHFHVVGINFECCPCIYEPLYFNHGYKTDKLSKKELKILDTWLRQAHKNLNISNWEYICMIWEECGNPMNIANKYKNPVQPHYEDTVNMRN